MKKAAAGFILIALWSVVPTSGAQTPNAISAARFSRPQIVADVNPSSTVAGHFNCSTNGTIYAFLDGYTPNANRHSATDRMALLGIRPDGSVINFEWHYITGYSRVIWPESVFVGYGHINVLVEADSSTTGRPEKRFVVLTFNPKGTLVRTTPLKPGIEPLALGVFKSGNMILLSEDRLNGRMALDLIAADGRSIRQLDLGREDYLALASTMPNGPGKYESSFLIASSTFHPFGDDLLLAPTVMSGLPIIELSEHGVAKAVVSKIPDGSVAYQFLSATPTTLNLRLGAIIPSQHPVMDSAGKQMGIMGITPSNDITSISLADGSILRRASFGSSSVQPTCEANGSLYLLTSTGSPGFLSVTSEKMP